MLKTILKSRKDSKFLSIALNPLSYAYAYLMCRTTPAMAQLATRAESVTEETGAYGTLVFQIMFLAGVGLFGFGLFMLWSSRGGQGGGKGAGVVACIIGGALAGSPALLEDTSQTITGGSATALEKLGIQE